MVFWNIAWPLPFIWSYVRCFYNNLYGIHTRGTVNGTTFNRITSNNNGNSGMFLEYSGVLVNIQNSWFEGNTEYAIRFLSPNQANINKCYFEDNGCVVLCVNSTDDYSTLVLRENYINHSEDFRAIHAGQTYVTLDSNVILWGAPTEQPLVWITGMGRIIDMNTNYLNGVKPNEPYSLSRISMLVEKDNGITTDYKMIAKGGLAVGNGVTGNVAATTPLNKVEIFDADGVSLGFIQTYQG